MVQPRILGIDPAPTKAATIWGEDGLCRRPPAELRSFLKNRLDLSRGLVVVWDSPLSFDPDEGFSDRSFDRAVRAWISERVREGLIESKAVSVRPFCGCPHWALSCQVLGHPFGQEIEGISLYCATDSTPVLEPGRGVALEVHPAVALAALWIDRGIAPPFPRYKGSAHRDSPAVIARSLGFPELAGEDDDSLDAFIAYRLGTQLLSGEAFFVGDPVGGGYLLPAGGCATEISERALGARRTG